MEKTWIEHIAGGSLYVSTEASLAFYAALVFVAGGFLCICHLFADRFSKWHYGAREISLRFQYQKILNKIVVNESFSEKGAPNAAFEYYMAELRLIMGNSNFARQLLLAQVLEVKKNLTGNSATALVKTYYALHLYNESLKKIKTNKWQKKAMGIRELAEMGYRKSSPLVAKFLNSDNQALMEESFMALVRLEDKPLSFLNDYKGDLSLWMRINIYRYLQHLDQRKVPLFNQYFNHPNISVRLFSISMARQFKQRSSLPDLAELLYSDNAAVVGLAISALGELEGYEYRQEITNLSTHVWRFEKLAKRIVKCLGSIGNKETDIPLVGKFLSHPSYWVRFEAVSVLKTFGIQGEEFLQQFNSNNKKSIDTILRHFSDPLLA